MIEDDLRKQAKKNAEFITPQKLRDYLKEEVGDVKDKIIFDCSIGSGQLLYGIDAKYKIGVDIQDRKEVCLKNGINEFYQNDYILFDDRNINYDICISNYPFSLRATDEQETYLKNYYGTKKINKTLDEHFIIKSFNKAKEKGFYLCFPGIAYRRTEKGFRINIIDNNYVEKAILLENCNFEATTINIWYLKLNKNKQDNNVILGVKDMNGEIEDYIENKTIDELKEEDYKLFISRPVKNNYSEFIEDIEYERHIKEYMEMKHQGDNLDLQILNNLIQLEIKDRKEKGGGLKIEELNNCIIDETLDKVEKMLINQLEILKIMEEADLPLQKEKIIKRLNSVINKVESIDYDNR